MKNLPPSFADSSRSLLQPHRGLFQRLYGFSLSCRGSKSLRDLATFGGWATLDSVAGRRSRFVQGKADFKQPWVFPGAFGWRGVVAMLAVAVTPLLALEPAQWQQQASVEVPVAGVARIDLPAEVIDAAAANLADLRLLDPQGHETPYAVVRPPQALLPQVVMPRFDVKLVEGATVVTVRTSTAELLLHAEILTAPVDFMKSASVETSADGEQWNVLSSGLPLFRRGGTVSALLPLLERKTAFLRITLDDRQTPPLPITGVTLMPVATAAVEPPSVIQPVGISQREEFAGETVLTLDLGAEHLAVTALELETSAPALSRPFTLTERRMHDEMLVEHTIARGMLTRLPTPADAPVVVRWAGAGAPPLLPAREVLLHIDNGDSPPLPLSAVAVRRLQREVVFTAEQAGTWSLLVGNPAATPPRYDIARFSKELPVGAQNLSIGRLLANPAYQTPPEALAEVSLRGAALDPSRWSYRRTVVLGGNGVQQLELDLGVLAHARTDFADVRLFSGGQQIPYLIESTSLTREFAATIESTDDPRLPQVSRWRVVLPQTGLPLRRLVLATSTPLFQRRVRVLNSYIDARGQAAERLLAEAVWSRPPKQSPQNLVLALDAQRLGQEVVIETDNGDNPPITLTSVRGAVGVTRLLFKPMEGGAATELLCGNSEVGPARYDLVLIAPQILEAPKQRASLGGETTAAGAGLQQWVTGRAGMVLLWLVLGGVVVVLLVVVTRLLPKPESHP